MKKDRSFFVAMPNKMFAFETDYFVTDDEFLLFYHLGTIVQARDTNLVLTSIDLLCSIIDYGDTNFSRRKTKVKTALLALEKKGYISIECNSNPIGNSTYLEVKIINLQHSIYTETVKSGAWSYLGFTQVTDEMVYKTKNVKQLKVLTYITWRSGINYAISYNEWEKVLGVSHQTAVNIITECHEKGLIRKLRGDYYETPNGEIRQETNRYEINPSTNEKEFNLVKEINTVFKSTVAEEKTIEKRENSWFKTGDESKLKVEDMVIYLTTTCLVLKKHAEKRINGIEKTSGGRSLIERLKEKATDRIKKENSIKKYIEANEKVEIQYLEDLMDERPYNYKKAETTDYSYFLEDDDNVKADEDDDLPMFA